LIPQLLCKKQSDDASPTNVTIESAFAWFGDAPVVVLLNCQLQITVVVTILIVIDYGVQSPPPLNETNVNHILLYNLWGKKQTLQKIPWSMTKFPWCFLISSQITLHSWRIVRFGHRFAALDMKAIWVQTLWCYANLITDFVTNHTASMTTVRFRHRIAVLDMKPDMKSKHYDVASISS
jgi:hypothetical protein